MNQEQEIRKHKKQKLTNSLLVGLFCLGLLAIVLIEDSQEKSIQNEELQLIRLKNLSFKQAYQIADNISHIGSLMIKSYKLKKTSKINKQLTHGIVYNKLKGTNLMIDPNIISVIQKIPEVYHLVFEILDSNNDKQVSENEFNNAIHGVYKHSQNQQLIDAFCKEMFSKINSGQSFNFTQFQTYFNSFLLSLINGNTNLFENTPPFENYKLKYGFFFFLNKEEDIKGLILYLASGRRIWDNCLLTAFKIFNINNDEYVTLEEIGQFLMNISNQTWNDAKPYLESILGYMRATGCAYGDKFNLGQLITFGELIRPYMGQILDKYIH